MATIEQARDLITRVLARRGHGVLFCDSCGEDTGRYIDGDHRDRDVLLIASLMTHTEMGHVSPRTLLFIPGNAVVSVWEAGRIL